MAFTFDEIDTLCVNNIRTLAIDAIQEANSGHPGAVMGLAPLAYVLFTRFLKHNPSQPEWPDRDRFVLSGGHASMLLYATLHLTGYELSLDEIKRFRQWGSQTPGHPEVELPGVEVTTGPLGQGCATAVGLALAEAHMAARFNTASHTLVDHKTYALCGDGDIMEGITSEAASLAGHLGLGKLVWIWDDNRITIEGATDLSFSEDVLQRFQSYGWNVARVSDVNDLPGLAAAIHAATAPDRDRPTLIAVRSHIGYGAPNKQDSADAHGAPLGPEEALAAKKFYNWETTQAFHIPEEVYERCRGAQIRGAASEKRWREVEAAWRQVNPDSAAEWSRRLAGDPPSQLPPFPADTAPVATRSCSGKVLNQLAEVMPELVGGSADLGPSCKTWIKGSDAMAAGAYGGRNLHFGIREHAMAALLNGLARHGGIRPFGSTFLVFSDYMRPAIRLAALMKLPVIYVFTHDSIHVGEDGPTHQPVEHLLALRSIPRLVVLRPADSNETSAAWQVAIAHREGPVALALSRQKLPILPASDELAETGVARGAYILAEATAAEPEIVLIASGSEVQLVVAASQLLAAQGIAARVVSMPSWELFDRMDRDYRKSVLGVGIPRLAVEAGISCGWHRYVGEEGAVIAVDDFGHSAPGPVVAEKLGLHPEAVVARAMTLLGRK